MQGIRLTQKFRERVRASRNYFNTTVDQKVGQAAANVRQFFLDYMRTSRQRTKHRWEALKSFLTVRKTEDKESSTTQKVKHFLLTGLAGVIFSPWLLVEAVAAAVVTVATSAAYLALTVVRGVGAVLVSVGIAVRQIAAYILMVMTWVVGIVALIFSVVALGVFTLLSFVTFGLDRAARALSMVKLPSFEGTVNEYVLDERRSFFRNKDDAPEPEKTWGPRLQPVNV